MATPVIAFNQLANEFEGDGLTPQHAEKLAGELAKTFSVQMDEVAIMKLEKTQLVFMYPSKLGQVGSIPLNTSSSVAARTASTKRAEAINNFAQTKHASVFESVKLSEKKSDPGTAARVPDPPNSRRRSGRGPAGTPRRRPQRYRRCRTSRLRSTRSL